MMVSDGAGGKISKIELVDLSPEDTKKAGETMDGPGGAKMSCRSSRQEAKDHGRDKDDNGSSTSTSESFIAEKDGKFVIPVPVTAK